MHSRMRLYSGGSKGLALGGSSTMLAGSKGKQPWSFRGCSPLRGPRLRRAGSRDGTSLVVGSKGGAKAPLVWFPKGTKALGSKPLANQRS
jgi:hypothetical protein